VCEFGINKRIILRCTANQISSTQNCCIPAVSRWRTYHRCCSWMRAEFELRLRSGRKGLLSVTITRHTNYIEFIMSEYRMYMLRGGGWELRLSVIYRGEGFVVLTVEHLTWTDLCSVRSDLREHRKCGKFGVNYSPEFSYSRTFYRGWPCLSVTSSCKLNFDTDTVRVTLVIITCSWRGMLLSMQAMQYNIHTAIYRVTPKMYTLFTHQYLWNNLWQCLDADGGHFEHLL
jgi:hypothetical protein